MGNVMFYCLSKDNFFASLGRTETELKKEFTLLSRFVSYLTQ